MLLLIFNILPFGVTHTLLLGVIHVTLINVRTQKLYLNMQAQVMIALSWLVQARRLKILVAQLMMLSKLVVQPVVIVMSR